MTASVFSSCAGSGALAASRIQLGVSALVAGANAPATATAPKSIPVANTFFMAPSVPRARLARLQDDLLIVVASHKREVTTQRCVFVLSHRHEVRSQDSLHVQGAFLALHL